MTTQPSCSPSLKSVTDCPAPLYATAPADRPHRLAEISKIAKYQGTPLMPWQQQVARVASELDEDGDMAYGVVVVTVQRQAGKSVLLSSAALDRCVAKERASIWYTAQTRANARDALMVMGDRVGRSKLAKLATLRRSNGSEGLYLVNGSFLRIFAPADDALHGTSNDMVCVDEGWAFDGYAGEALLQAIMPTFVTTAGQLWIVSTAGDGRSTWLKSFVDRGRLAVEAGLTSGIAYFEWGVPEGQDAQDLDVVLSHHPANGHTLKKRVLAEAQALMTPGEFARAYGNQWTQASDRLIPAALWEFQRLRKWTPEGRCALAVDVDMDGEASSISVVHKGSDGRLLGRLIERRQGVSWLLEAAPALAKQMKAVAVVADAKCVAPDVIAALGRVDGLPLRVTSAGEYIAACSLFMRGLKDGRMWILPDQDMDVAAAAAGKRSVGDGWVFSRRGSTASIAPLVSLSLAAWGVESADVHKLFVF